MWVFVLFGASSFVYQWCVLVAASQMWAVRDYTVYFTPLEQFQSASYQNCSPQEGLPTRPNAFLYLIRSYNCFAVM